MTTEALAPTRVLEGEFVEEVDASIEVSLNQGSRSQIVKVGIPKTFKDWTPLQRAVILKSTPKWSAYEIPYLMFLDAWAAKNGHDLFSGNVYVVNGNAAVDDDGKISNALRTGNVEYLTCSPIEKVTNPLTQTNDFAVTATLKLKTESKERTYTAFMSEWRNKSNAAWEKFPSDRLRRKAMARVCDEACPSGGDGEAFVPVALPAADSNGRELTGLVEEGIAKVSK